MPRSTGAVAKKKSRKRLFKRAKGFIGGRRKLARTAMETVNRADRYSFRDRRTKKREFRALWITRISAAARQHGMSYSRFIEGLNKANYDINRKVLAEVALTDETAFEKIVALSRNALN